MLGLSEALKIVHEAEFCHIVSITYDIRAWIKHIDNFQCRADTKVDNEYKSFAYSAKGWFSYDHNYHQRLLRLSHHILVLQTWRSKCLYSVRTQTIVDDL